jgi:hypothetical protein
VKSPPDAVEAAGGNDMDNAILKKRLNTFKAGKSGRLQDVSDEVVIDALRAWENWPGTTADLCRELGLSSMQMAVIIKKGKQLIKSGVVSESEFKEITPPEAASGAAAPCAAIELNWSNGTVIRFPRVDDLLDFLKRAA